MGRGALPARDRLPRGAGPEVRGKLALRSPRGLVRLISGMVRWTFDHEDIPVRLATVTGADPEAYLKLSQQRDSRMRLRVWIALPALLAAVAVLAVAVAGPPLARLGVLAVALTAWSRGPGLP
jgi:DNA segregation ATPase FtsK/SpoIIIE, S-DNA-T family